MKHGSAQNLLIVSVFNPSSRCAACSIPRWLRMPNARRAIIGVGKIVEDVASAAPNLPHPVFTHVQPDCTFLLPRETRRTGNGLEYRIVTTHETAQGPSIGKLVDYQPFEPQRIGRLSHLEFNELEFALRRESLRIARRGDETVLAANLPAVAVVLPRGQYLRPIANQVSV